MAQVSLVNVKKVYPSNITAVHDASLGIERREFMVLVGPSGCGKTTLLRMIAGLEEISGGRIYIGDKIVNDIPPKDRDIAMVFQSYALYPHMTVFQNMAFALKLRKYPKDEIVKRVNEAAEILGIDRQKDRIVRPFACRGQRPLHQLRADALAGVAGQGVKLAEFHRIGCVRISGVVAGVAQLAIGDEAAVLFGKAVGAAIARDLIGNRARRMDLRQKGGKVSLGIKVPESGDEGFGAQRGKRGGIGDGGGAFFGTPHQRAVHLDGTRRVIAAALRSNPEADQLVAAVTKTGIPFAMAHTYLGHWSARLARHIVRSGLLGDIRWVDSHYLQGWR